ncbi:phage holin family protein [Paeniglutamicibacter cryotolerans]|uniref:Putative membrane protein YqjE n=1 Tax=Paeniglutamicibacter cryotolerans TaxID=670079 RepID=A0A839QVS6_9MICC|nr:phage holin family protein [Paeniglutamicibacter cryotolerans]MBB2996111.1 putative membrane protein YqjE [Paeniglutamicibacter cryotolerans]
MTEAESTPLSGDRTAAPTTIKGQVSGLGRLVPRQLRDELSLALIALKASGIRLGIAAGAAVVAIVFLCFLLISLVVAAIMGLSTVMAPWLAALIVGAAFLLLALALAGFAVWRVKRSMPLVPEEALRGLRHDVGILREGSSFNEATLDEPREPRHKDEDQVAAKEAKAAAPKPTHDELLKRTRARRHEIALLRDGLGYKLEAPRKAAETVSKAAHSAGDGITRMAEAAHTTLVAAGEKLEAGKEAATQKLAEASGLSGENAGTALRERWAPLAVMTGSLIAFVVLVRKLFGK